MVFHRPLPYLYLSQQVLTEARVPYQAFDALPLAAEPYAALLDIVMTVARTGGTRDSVVELLRSRLPADRERWRAAVARPTWRRWIRRWPIAVSGGDAASFAAEIEAHFRGDQGRRSEAGRGGGPGRTSGGRGGSRAARVPRGGRPRPRRFASIVAFLRRHERLPDAADPWRERHLRARAAVLVALETLAEAFARHDDASRPHEDLTSAIGHAIEVQTFTPMRGTAGVQLVDSRGCAFRRVRPRPSGRSGRDGLARAPAAQHLLYERAAARPRVAAGNRSRARRARRLRGPAGTGRPDACGSPPFNSRATPSSRCRRWSNWRGTRRRPSAPEASRRRIFDDEVIPTAPIEALAIDPRTVRWLRERHARPDLSDARFGGSVGPPDPAAVSRQPRRSLRGLPVQVLRRERARPAGGTRGDRRPLASRARRPDSSACSKSSSATGTAIPAAPSRRRRCPARWRDSRRWPRPRWRGFRRPIGSWSGRACSDRSSRPASPSASSNSKPTPAIRSRTACSSRTCAARSTSRNWAASRRARSRSTARPTASTCSRTGRCASWTTSSAACRTRRRPSRSPCTPMRRASCSSRRTGGRTRSRRRCIWRLATRMGSRARSAAAIGRPPTWSSRASRPFAGDRGSHRGRRVSAAATAGGHVQLVPLRRRLPERVPGGGR